LPCTAPFHTNVLHPRHRLSWHFTDRVYFLIVDFYTITCELAFQYIKKRLTDAPILAYFDMNKEVVLQVDSSKNGVGAVSLQDGKPVEFASCALRQSERNCRRIHVHDTGSLLTIIVVIVAHKCSA
jgi:hypothetical protein